LIQDPLFGPFVQYCLLMGFTMALKVLIRPKGAVRFSLHFLFFALLSAGLLHQGAAPWLVADPGADLTDKILIGVAKMSWWVGGAMVLASFVRVFLVLEQRPREGRLLQDLLVGVIYLGAVLSIVAFVFDLPVGTLIATSGAFAIVLGLALQSTLNDVFSGVALNLGRPYSIGDVIVLDTGVQGSVVETNWRATHLLTGTNDLVIVPNSLLAKARVTNLTSLEQSHGVSLTVRLRLTRAPSIILDVMRTVLLSSNVILKKPEPNVTITALDASIIELELEFRIPDVNALSAAKNEIYDLVYRHAKASGLKLAESETDKEEGLLDVPKISDADQRLITSLTLFSTLTDEEKKTVASSMRRSTYKKGEVIARQDSILTSLMIVRSGVASESRQEAGHGTELRRLSPGDMFGERGVLIAAQQPGEIKALTNVVVCEIPKDGIASVIENRPELAEQLGVLLAKRLNDEKNLEVNGLARAPTVRSIGARIRHLFDVPGERS